jgi:short-subunit dehydrogenase
MRPPLDRGTILVTGASAGIGAALARQLAPRARTLILVARREEPLRELATELKRANSGLLVEVEPCDLADREATKALADRLLDRLDQVDVLINNAGVADIAAVERSRWERIESMIQLNVTSLSYLVHRLLPGMIERRSGGILNVSSAFGLTFLPGFAGYVGTKHYVTGYTECLRLEVQQRGIVVSQLCPGPVDTDFEVNAGNRDRSLSPRFVVLGADRCARVALRQFARGKALIVPGFWMRLGLFLYRITPRWLLRLVLGRAGRRMPHMAPALKPSSGKGGSSEPPR